MGQIMFVAILSFTAATALSAQQPARPDCSAPEHHQFDFWIGSWDVFNAQGAKIGTNEITPILKGCVLKEHWEGGRGGIGFVRRGAYLSRESRRFPHSIPGQ